MSLTYFGPVFSPPFLRLFFREMLPAVEKQIEFSTHGKFNYQFTRGNFFLTRLSIVKSPLLAAVHKKKDTLLGTLTHQMLFQGKDTNGATRKEK